MDPYLIYEDGTLLDIFNFASVEELNNFKQNNPKLTAIPATQLEEFNLLDDDVYYDSDEWEP